MKPYWQTADARAVVYEADALALLPTLDAASVDLIVADPPYNGVKDAAWDNQWKTDADYLAWMGSVLDGFQRVLKPNGSLYLFASPQMAWGVEGEVRRRLTVLTNIRWIKDEGWAKRQCKEEQREFFPASETIIFAEQRAADCDAMREAGYDEAARLLHQKVYAPIGQRVAAKREAAGLQRWEVDVACAPSKKPTRLCYRWEEGACLPTLEQYANLCRLVGDAREYEDLRREYEDLRREYEDLRRPFSVSADVPYTDVWDFPTVQAYKGKHVCEKSMTLLAHIVKASSRPDALVLDPFMGSGALGQACVELGRRYIGVEKCERWVGHAAHRIGTATQSVAWLGIEQPMMRQGSFPEPRPA